MTLLRVLLMSIVFVASVQSFPSTTIDNEKESTAVQETKETTSTYPVHAEEPQTVLDKETTSDRESSVMEFAFKSSKEGVSVRKGSAHEKYAIANLPSKNVEKLNMLDSSKDNEIDIDVKDELLKLNITGISKGEDLLPVEQIKKDQWLLDPQEMSSITGKLPQLFYDAIKPIFPFPELSEAIKPIHTLPKLSETAKFYKNLGELASKSYERSYESLELGGPQLYPQSALMREIGDSFYGEDRK